jgi:hypothetical protein
MTRIETGIGIGSGLLKPMFRQCEMGRATIGESISDQGSA